MPRRNHLLELADLHYSPVDNNQLIAFIERSWKISYTLPVIVIISYYLMTRKRNRRWPRFWFPVMFLIVYIFFFHGLLLLSNAWLDNSAPRPVKTAVTDKKIGYLEFHHWDETERPLHWHFGGSKSRPPSFYWVKIGKTQITAVVKKGYWGIEYYVRGSIRVPRDHNPDPAG